MNIHIPTQKESRQNPAKMRGTFRNKRGEKVADPNYPVEVQYSPEELERIHKAALFTKMMFPQNAENLSE